MSDYSAWNNALLESMFSPAQSGETIFFPSCKEELSSIAPELGGYEGLCRAVKLGPRWLDGTHQLLSREGSHLLVEFRKRNNALGGLYIDPSIGIEYISIADCAPTYLPVLAVLVAAYGTLVHGEGGFYEEIISDLDLPVTWRTTGMLGIEHLWKDLEAWTEETNYKYGKFVSRVAGKRIHVGRLKAQSLFALRDYNNIRKLFAWSGISPGHELDDTQSKSILKQIPSRVNDFSSSLRSDILDEIDERDGASELLDELVSRVKDEFKDWDGSLPSKSGSDNSSSNSVQASLALKLGSGRTSWEVGFWGDGVMAEDCPVAINKEEFSWKGEMIDSEYCVMPAHSQDTAQHAEILEFLEPGDTERKELSVTLDDGETMQVDFYNKPLRVFVKSAKDNLFRERPLPLNGPVYFLCRPDNKESFSSLGSREGIELKPGPSGGLPCGWSMWYVEDASTLAEIELPDGLNAETRSRAMVLSLIGGARVARGGRRTFLPYNLPSIRLDCIVGAEIEAEGLELNEVIIARDSHDDDLPFETSREFEIASVDENVHFVDIRAIDKATGELKGRVDLRLQSGEASPTLGAPAWGVNQQGDSVPASLGLSGMDLHSTFFSAETPSAGGMNVTRNDLGSRLDSEPLNHFHTPEARWMNHLACSNANAIPYGQAKIHYRQYCRTPNFEEKSFPQFIKQLKIRGVVEVKTNTHGMWVAIARVAPHLYRLTLTADGNSTWGVAGTLSLQHWSRLFDLGASIYECRMSEDYLPVIRICGKFDNDLAEEYGFKISNSPPCSSIATYSISLSDYREDNERNGLESAPVSGDGNPLQHFNPFNPRVKWLNAEAMISTLPCSLKRYKDCYAGIAYLYSLKSIIGGQASYRYMNDPGLGYWLSVTAGWYHFFKDSEEGLPLMYDLRKNDLWLPQVLRAPDVLERALVASSGGPPIVERLSNLIDKNARIRSGGRLINVPVFYSDYIANSAEDNWSGKWLRYRHVPLELAVTVAGKLGCYLSTESRVIYDG